MKKIFSFIFALAMGASVLNAQVTTENAHILDNWFVGANVGAVAPVDHSFDWAKHDWLGNYHKEFGVEVGKWVTPVVGLGVSYEVQGDLNQSKTWADMGLVTADVHFNLTNLFAGYTGTPHSWEFEAIPSVGYVHFYGDVYPSPHRFMAAGRVALSANYNFGKDKQWTAYVRPGIEYVDHIRHYNGLFDARVGVTYKFKGYKSKSYNFVACPYTRTEDEYCAIYNELDALRKSRQTPEVHEVVKEVVREVPVPVNVVNEYVAVFGFNSAEITPFAKMTLDRIPTDATVRIDGYASPDRGTDVTNMKVSVGRSNMVKAYLESRGIKVAEVESHGAENAFSTQIVKVTVLK